MRPSPPNPPPAAAASSLMAMKMKAIKYLHLFAEGALSFFAFLLSIFIYFSVFNLSLSTDLLNHTKFWFCISNTLIFIIAADCGAFSPPPASFHACRRRNSPAKLPNQLNPNQPHNSDVITVLSQPPDSAKPTRIPHTKEVAIPLKFHNRKKSYQRSKSEKEMDQVKERTIPMRRSKTMTRHDTMVLTKKEEEKKNEFVEMTDEELNRRVEEFIKRFNRQIRLEDDEIGHGDE